MNNKTKIVIFVAVVLLLGYYVSKYQGPAFDFTGNDKDNSGKLSGPVSEALAARFNYLSQNGNSSCSVSFRESISSMPDDARLIGSCCSPMSLHRYSEQVEGLKKFSAKGGSASGGKSIVEQNIDKIPEDPYDIEAGLAKELMSYYDMELTSDERQAYDYAMENSSEKGPCCCKCWRWYVYGGLGKYLIKNHSFTGEQITELWNLSDGCGGDSEHHHG